MTAGQPVSGSYCMGMWSPATSVAATTFSGEEPPKHESGFHESLS